MGRRTVEHYGMIGQVHTLQAGFCNMAMPAPPPKSLRGMELVLAGWRTLHGSACSQRAMWQEQIQFVFMSSACRTP